MELSPPFSDQKIQKLTLEINLWMMVFFGLCTIQNQFSPDFSKKHKILIEMEVSDIKKIFYQID